MARLDHGQNPLYQSGAVAAVGNSALRNYQRLRQFCPAISNRPKTAYSGYGNDSATRCNHPVQTRIACAQSARSLRASRMETARCCASADATPIKFSYSRPDRHSRSERFFAPSAGDAENHGDRRCRNQYDFFAAFKAPGALLPSYRRSANPDNPTSAYGHTQRYPRAMARRSGASAVLSYPERI